MSLIGLTFVLSGFALLLGQIATIEAYRAYKRLLSETNAICGHDAQVFPDSLDFLTSTSP